MELYIGLIAGFLTTISSIPQVIKSFKTQSTSDLSILTLILLLSGLLLWSIYGFYMNDIPVILTNCFSFALTGSLLLLKFNHWLRGYN